MTVRNITGNIIDITGSASGQTSFTIIPENYAFGSDPNTVVFGDIKTVTSDSSGDVDFDLHEGKYLGRISTSQGAKTFGITVDSEGPWVLGRLVGEIGPFDPTLIQDVFTAAQDAQDAAQAAQDAAAGVEFPVSYAPQSLSGSEQEQARDNIGLGTAAVEDAVVSETDATSGRVLTNFAWGLGSENAPLFSDLDLAVNSGFFTIATGSDNAPFTQGGSLIVVARAGVSFVTQYASRQTEADLLHVRVKAGAGWTPWRRVYTQADIVGTVSEDGGVPTGAIIQRGDGPNGEFVRFADGTQICTRLIDEMPRASNNGFFRTVNFQALFSEPPVVTLTYGSADGYSNNDMGPMRVSGVVSDAVSIVALRSFGAPNVPSGAVLENVNLTAIGRWY